MLLSSTARQKLICCCLLASLLTACERSDSGKTPVVSGPTETTFPMPPVSGKSLKDMGWQLADGQRNYFSQYAGNVLILDFYATWCLPCRNSIPHLVDMERRFKDQGFRVIGLNVGGPDDWPKVADFARELKIQYTLAIPDPDLTGFLLSDSQQIPQTFVFDRKGELVKRVIGYTDADGELIEQVVRAEIENK